MIFICDTNFPEFACIIEEIQVLRCEKMKFRNAWSHRQGES